jgi:hypothetical protein
MPQIRLTAPLTARAGEHVPIAIRVQAADAPAPQVISVELKAHGRAFPGIARIAAGADGTPMEADWYIWLDHSERLGVMVVTDDGVRHHAYRTILVR